MKISTPNCDGIIFEISNVILKWNIELQAVNLDKPEFEKSQNK